MSNRFDEVMSRRTDIELIKILKEQRSEYQPEAVEAAEREFAKRNLSEADISHSMSVLEEEKNIEEARSKAPLNPGFKAIAFFLPGFYTMIASGVLSAGGHKRKGDDMARWTTFGCIFYITMGILLTLAIKFL
jgi:hypothetical protein